MMVKLLRIDYRLVHGQILFSWIPFLDSDCILVANDAILKEQIRMITMEMGRPKGVKLVFKSMDGSIRAICSGETVCYRLLILVDSVADAEMLTAKCPCIKEVNLGWTKRTDSKRRLAAAVYADEKEIGLMKKMISRGIRVEMRQTPSESPVDVKDLF